MDAACKELPKTLWNQLLAVPLKVVHMGFLKTLESRSAYKVDLSKVDWDMGSGVVMAK